MAFLGARCPRERAAWRVGTQDCAPKGIEASEPRDSVPAQTAGARKIGTTITIVISRTNCEGICSRSHLPDGTSLAGCRFMLAQRSIARSTIFFQFDG